MNATPEMNVKIYELLFGIENIIRGQPFFDDASA
jgi:hypothetical protein